MAEAPRIDWRSPRLWGTTLAFVVAIALCLTYIDLPLALYMKRHVSEPVFDVFWKICKLGEGGIWAGLAVAIWVVPRCVRGWRERHGRDGGIDTRRYAWMSAYMLGVLATNGIVVNILKHALGRYRPSKFFQTGHHEFSFFVIFQKSDSFPSGHAATIWGAMICLWFLYPRLRWLYVVVAVTVSFGRVVVTKHYLGDVVAGAGLALAVCLLLKRAIERRTGIRIASNSL